MGFRGLGFWGLGFSLGFGGKGLGSLGYGGLGCCVSGFRVQSLLCKGSFTRCPGAEWWSLGVLPHGTITVFCAIKTLLTGRRGPNLASTLNLFFVSVSSGSRVYFDSSIEGRVSNCVAVRGLGPSCWALMFVAFDVCAPPLHSKQAESTLSNGS